MAKLCKLSAAGALLEIVLNFTDGKTQWTADPLTYNKVNLLLCNVLKLDIHVDIASLELSTFDAILRPLCCLQGLFSARVLPIIGICCGVTEIWAVLERFLCLYTSLSSPWGSCHQTSTTYS